MAKFCVACGAANSNNANQCSRCGKMIGGMGVGINPNIQRNQNTYSEPLNQKQRNIQQNKNNNSINKKMSQIQRPVQQPRKIQQGQVVAKPSKKMPIGIVVGVVVFAICFVVGFCVSSQNKKNALIGSWKHSGDLNAVRLHFTKEGTIFQTDLLDSDVENFSYKVSGDILKVYNESSGEWDEFEIEISEDTLIITDVDGSQEVYMRE